MYKTVLALLTGTDCDNSVLALSYRLIAANGGHIECLRLNPDPADIIAQASYAEMGSWMVLSDTIAVIEKEGKERTEQAKATFDSFAAQQKLRIAKEPSAAGVSIAWNLEVGDEFDHVTAIARYHDAVVLAGGADRAGRLP